MHRNIDFTGLDAPLWAVKLGIAGIYCHFGVMASQHLPTLGGVQGHCRRPTYQPG